MTLVHGNSAIWTCTGCGSTTFDPINQLHVMWHETRHQSCCPERHMVIAATLPTSLTRRIVFARIPDEAPDELRAAHPWCWQWAGHQNRNGYGRVCWQGKEPVVHRLVRELLIGPIPEGLLVNHLCFNRACCNPNHNENATHRENTHHGKATLFKKREDYGQSTQS